MKATMIMSLFRMINRGWYCTITELSSGEIVYEGKFFGILKGREVKEMATKRSGANLRGFKGHRWRHDSQNNRFLKYNGDQP